MAPAFACRMASKAGSYSCSPTALAGARQLSRSKMVALMDPRFTDQKVSHKGVRCESPAVARYRVASGRRVANFRISNLDFRLHCEKESLRRTMIGSVNFCALRL